MTIQEELQKQGNIGDQVIELLSRQRALYQQLHELATKQTELVDGKNPEMLLKLLAARQRLIDRLTDIDRKLQPIRSEWDNIAPQMTESQRLEIQRLVENVQKILSDIIHRDKEDTQRLSDQKESVAHEIRGAQSGKRVNHAYAYQHNSDQGRMFDTKNV